MDCPRRRRGGQAAPRWRAAREARNRCLLQRHSEKGRQRYMGNAAYFDLPLPFGRDDAALELESSGGGLPLKRWYLICLWRPERRVISDGGHTVTLYTPAARAGTD